MDKKVYFWPFASKDGENLYNATCFEGCLLNELKNAEKFNQKYNLHKGMELLIDAINKCKQHPQDELHEIFLDTAKIDYDFAKQVNRLDIINHDCFEFETDKGKAMAKLIAYADIKFIVTKKQWSKRGIELEFEVVHGDMEDSAIFKINSGEYCSV